MSIPSIIYDPYRKRNTTYSEFAAAEHCRLMAAYLYNRRHGSLNGFRDRPKTGNGIKPHTYMRNGKYITISEAAHIVGVSASQLSRYAKLGIVDTDEIIAYRQRKRLTRGRTIPSDSGIVTATEYAVRMNVTKNTVYQYIKNHGDLRGFTTRGHSRINPKLYPHDGMGISKSANDWAQYFKCSRNSIKQWLLAHGLKMDGFEIRKVGRQPYQVEHDGKTATLREWAHMLGMPLCRVRKYYYTHKTLDGIGTRKRGRKRRN